MLQKKIIFKKIMQAVNSNRSKSHEMQNPIQLSHHHQKAHQNLSIDNFFGPISPVPDTIAMDSTTLQLHHQRLQEQQQQLSQQLMKLQQLMHLQRHHQQQNSSVPNCHAEQSIEESMVIGHPWLKEQLVQNRMAQVSNTSIWLQNIIPASSLHSHIL